MTTDSARTYKVVQEEISRLQEEARKLLAVERDKAIAEIKVKISEFSLTAKDLGLTSERASLPQSKGTLPAKYRGPKGQEWSGRGRQPDWYKEALKEGKTSEDFLIK